MRNIDEDNITQAVIARHAAAGNARLRELMTSLVQHVHAFAREVKLSEAEWAEGIRFITECGGLSRGRRQEVALLSDALGLSMLVTALNHRHPKGCTEATVASHGHGVDVDHAASGEPCYVRGRVQTLDGKPVAGAEVKFWHADADAGAVHDANDVQPADLNEPRARGTLTSGADGTFHFKSIVAEPRAIPHDGPVGSLLQALGRHAWRPAHLHFKITAPGCERLVTHVFRSGDPYLDSDAVFGVRSSLVADWVHHAPGRTPDGHTSAVPFYTLDFAFVLNATTGDKP